MCYEKFRIYLKKIFGCIFCIICFFVIMGLIAGIVETTQVNDPDKFKNCLIGLISSLIMLLIFGIPAFFLLKPKKKTIAQNQPNPIQYSSINQPRTNQPNCIYPTKNKVFTLKKKNIFFDFSHYISICNCIQYWKIKF